MTTTPIIVDEALLAELDALAEAAGMPLSPEQCSAVFIRVKDRQYDDFHAAASPDVVRALVAEVKRLRGDEAQLVALVARAHVEDADDAPLPAPSPDPCQATKLQAAIETLTHSALVRVLELWDAPDTEYGPRRVPLLEGSRLLNVGLLQDHAERGPGSVERSPLGTALLAVLAAAERVPALEARAELAEARLAALHTWCAEPGGTQSIYGGRDGALAERADCIGTLIAHRRESLPELAEALRVAGPEGSAP